MSSSISAKPLKTVHSSSEEETRALARSLGSLLKPGDWVALVGELGAGKTQFVKGLAEALHCKEEPSSPTFALAQIHKTASRDCALRHVDLYRLEPKDVPALGWEDLSDDLGVTVVEWAEKARGLWPPHAVEVRLAHDGENRRIIAFYGGDRAQELARKTELRSPQ
jgi:tRNA threonylcarbamoyladenosine biosynthesis protein TsaE